MRSSALLIHLYNSAFFVPKDFVGSVASGVRQAAGKDIGKIVGNPEEGLQNFPSMKEFV
jgi:hypothetical protein